MHSSRYSDVYFSQFFKIKHEVYTENSQELHV